MGEMSSINLVFEPRVRLVGRQSIDGEALTAFLADNDVATWETDTEVAGEKIVETAGRVCYMSFAKPRPGGNRAYIGHILEVGHGSVLEHAVFNLIIEGVSRSLTHELVRHRAGFGYSQLSQRFVDESKADFVVPPMYRAEVEAAREYIRSKGGDLFIARMHAEEDARDAATDADGGVAAGWPFPGGYPGLLAGLDWLVAMEGARGTYGRLSDYGMRKMAAIEDKTLRRKAAREAARSVLPNATETKLVVTGNARALRHFIAMRGDISADAEIRRLAVAVASILRDDAPNLFQDVLIDRRDDPVGFVHILHPKV